MQGAHAQDLVQHPRPGARGQLQLGQQLRLLPAELQHHAQRLAAEEHHPHLSESVIDLACLAPEGGSTSDSHACASQGHPWADTEGYLSDLLPWRLWYPWWRHHLLHHCHPPGLGCHCCRSAWTLGWRCRRRRRMSPGAAGSRREACYRRRRCLQRGGEERTRGNGVGEHADQQRWLGRTRSRCQKAEQKGHGSSVDRRLAVKAESFGRETTQGTLGRLLNS